MLFTGTDQQKEQQAVNRSLDGGARFDKEEKIVYVQRGSLGLKYLGAIDYLINYCKYFVVFTH